VSNGGLIEDNIQTCAWSDWGKLCRASVRPWRIHLQDRRVSQASFSCCMSHAGFLSDLVFNPEDGGDMFLRKVGWLSTDKTVFYLRRQNSSQAMLSEPQMIHIFTSLDLPSLSCYFILFLFCSWDSEVGRATGYGLDGRGSEFEFQ
jgi:hypothetical protein